ncbi:Deltamethrin resistance protein prag01 [Cinara cedri]|uniref:Deltamethrin resistance protein prag01 n=1 Tax=Cinara cedri TaxID=506608 RepID=A0A5E4N1V7_9HEMI|nr:Deltamethrin resistance protein prag01 [Cinara cedri]
MSRVLSQLKKSTTVLRMAVRSKSDHHLSYPAVSMDDMPVPTVPYKEFYSKNNAKYNAVLVGGIVSLAVSIYILQDNCFFNAFEPPYPFEDEQK